MWLTIRASSVTCMGNAHVWIIWRTTQIISNLFLKKKSRSTYLFRNFLFATKGCNTCSFRNFPILFLVWLFKLSGLIQIQQNIENMCCKIRTRECPDATKYTGYFDPKVLSAPFEALVDALYDLSRGDRPRIAEVMLHRTWQELGAIASFRIHNTLNFTIFAELVRHAFNGLFMSTVEKYK